MFPSGWPGGGLLILRTTDGAFLIYGCLFENTATWHSATGILMGITVVMGLLILAGFWTPFAGFLSALAEIVLFTYGSADPKTAVFVIATGIALAMLGPGRWSIDALIYGRQRLELPDR